MLALIERTPEEKKRHAAAAPAKLARDADLLCLRDTIDLALTYTPYTHP
jgi:hypothetical protein